MITLHDLHPAQRRSRRKRVGRGNASGKGTTAGRGTKGQRARSGGRKKLIRRGLKHLIERTPKVRGFRSARPKLQVVAVGALAVFPDGATVTALDLKRHGLISQTNPGVKILGGGAIKKKLIVRVDRFSRSAKQAIINAGGQAVTLRAAAPTAEDKAA